MRDVVAVICLLTFVVGCGSAKPVATPAVTGAWATVAAAPASLTEVAVAVHDGRIWVAGGLRADGTGSDEAFVFDPAAGTWTIGPKLPEAIHHSALVSTPDGLVLIGGYLGNELNVITDAVRRLDDGATAWTDGVKLPDFRAAGGAAFDGTRIVYAGGVKPGAVASEVFALASDGTSWMTIGRLPTAREHLAVTTDGAGRTFVLGGRVGGLDSNLALVDVIEGSGNEAVKSVGELPTKRGGVAAFWWESLGACLAGGESPGGTNPQVECIAPDGSLARLPDLGVARHGLGAAVVDGTAYVVLGGRQPGLFTSDVTETLRLP